MPSSRERTTLSSRSRRAEGSRYGRLVAWLDRWTRAAARPDEALLGRWLPNIVEATLAELARKKDPAEKAPRGKRSWLSELLDLLGEAVSRRDALCALYDAEYPLEMNALRGHIANPTATIGDYSSVLSLLARGLAAKRLARLLMTALSPSRPFRDETLDVLALLLYRRVATREAPSYYSGLPKRLLVRASLRETIRPHLGILSGDAVLTRTVEDGIRAFLHGAEIHAQMERATVTRAESSDDHPLIDDLFDDFGWTRRVERTLRRLGQRWSDLLASPSTTPQPLGPGWVMAADERAALGQLVVELVGEAAVAHVAERAASDERRSVPRSSAADAIDGASEAISDHLVALIGFGENRDRYPEERLRTLDLFSADALLGSAGGLIAERGGRRAASTAGSALAVDIGDALDGIFAMRRARRDPAAVDSPALIAECLAAREARVILGTAIAPVWASVFSAGAYSALIDEFLAAISADSKSFWSAWHSAAVNVSGRYEELVHLCPWEKMSPGVFARIIDALVKGLEPLDEMWRVTAELEGVEAGGALWRVGDVVFYDLAEYGFGGGLARQTPDLPISGVLLHQPTTKAPNEVPLRTGVVVDVRADSAQHAVRLSRERALSAIDLLSIGMLKKERGHGLRVRLSAPTSVANLSRELWSGSWEQDGGGRPYGGRHAVRDGLVALGADAQRLFSILEKGRTPTDFERRVIRAIGRFRHGFYAERPLDRLLSYWIGLEQLVPASAIKAIDVAASLHITWRDVEGLSLSQAWRRRIRNGVAKAPNFLRDFGPVSDYAVTLRISETNCEAWATTREDAHAALRRFADPPPEVPWRSGKPRDYSPAVEAEVTYRRARARFALHRIYDARNQIVHEALPARLDLHVYADAAERIVADALGKIVERFLAPGPPPASVADVQRFLDTPWMKHLHSE